MDQSLTEHLIEEVHFVPKRLMWVRLEFRAPEMGAAEEKFFANQAKGGSQGQQFFQRMEQRGLTASLEDKAIGSDKHAAFT